MIKDKKMKKTYTHLEVLRFLAKSEDPRAKDISKRYIEKLIKDLHKRYEK